MPPELRFKQVLSERQAPTPKICVTPKRKSFPECQAAGHRPHCSLQASRVAALPLLHILQVRPSVTLASAPFEVYGDGMSGARQATPPFGAS